MQKNSLDTFVELFNSNSSLRFALTSDDTEIFRNKAGFAFNRQVVDRGRRTHIGLSDLGRPAVLTGIKALGYLEDLYPDKAVARCLLGDLFEEYILLMLNKYCSYAACVQMEVDFHGIKGHIDAIYNDSIIVEVKTMSSHYWTGFVKSPDDRKGYITQLSLYSMALDKPASWLCLNTETFELAHVPLHKVDSVMIEEKLTRAEILIKQLKEIQQSEDKTIKEVLDRFDAPSPVPEFYKKQTTGKYLIPESMKYSKYTPVFYNLNQEKNGYNKLTTYVTGIPSIEESQRRFEDITEVPF
jgi:hypothetical protein